MSTSVLVIDPSPIVHRTVQASLGGDVQVQAERGGLAARSALETKSWDLIMLAAKMGGDESAMDLVEVIRTKVPTARLVLMVGVMQEPDPALITSMEPDEVIRKAWSSRDLQQLVERLVAEGPREVRSPVSPVSESLPPVAHEVADDLPPPAEAAEPDSPSVDEPAIVDPLLADPTVSSDGQFLDLADEESLPPLPDDESLPPFSDHASMEPMPADLAAFDDDLPPLPALEDLAFDDGPAPLDAQSEGSETVGAEVEEAAGLEAFLPDDDAGQEPAPPPELVDAAVDDLLSQVSSLDAVESLDASLAGLPDGGEDIGTDPPEATEAADSTMPPEEARVAPELSEQLAAVDESDRLWEPQGTSGFGDGIRDDEPAAEPSNLFVAEAEVFDPSMQDQMVTMPVGPAGDAMTVGATAGPDAVAADAVVAEAVAAEPVVAEAVAAEAVVAEAVAAEAVVAEAVAAEAVVAEAVAAEAVVAEAVAAEAVVAEAVAAEAIVAEAIAAEAVAAEAVVAEAVAAEAVVAEAVAAGAVAAEAVVAEAVAAEALPAGVVPADAVVAEGWAVEVASAAAEAVPAAVESVVAGIPTPSAGETPVADAQPVVAAEAISERPAPVMTMDQEFIRQEVQAAVERVVWDLVPDLAEKIVREEIRRLTELPEQR